MRLLMTFAYEAAGQKKEYFQYNHIEIQDVDIDSLSNNGLKTRPCSFWLEHIGLKDSFAQSSCSVMTIAPPGKDWEKRLIALSKDDVIRKVKDAADQGKGVVDLRPYTGAQAFDYKIRW